MRIPEHPQILLALRTGYPVRMQEEESEEFDEDARYDEMRERERLGEDF